MKDDKIKLSNFSIFLGLISALIAYLLLINIDSLISNKHFVEESNISINKVVEQKKLDLDCFYWLFSASAQSIAAFIALLLTGYAIVLSLMSNIEVKDETLSDILHELKVKYYKYLIVIGTITGSAIIMSLYSIYINRKFTIFNVFIYVINTCLNILAIVGGIGFMLFIINPNKYKKIASKLYEKESEKLDLVGEKVKGLVFFHEFIKLEKIIREFIESMEKKQQIYIEQRYYKNELRSFKVMIDILLHNEIFDSEFYLRLSEINKIRNLVAHGKIDDVDQKIISMTKEAIEHIGIYFEKKYNQSKSDDTEKLS